ncbi:hypothetical protein V6N13_146555 [Hibiscus sabdariffa]
MPQPLKAQIGDILEVRISTNPEKYLGLPTMVGRRKREAFHHYFDRFNKLINSWSVRNLSKGGPGNDRVNQNIDIRFPRVSDLIVTETNTWRSSLVHSLFDPSLANIILCIPLGKSKPPDELIWRGDNTGIYSPKSGYKILLEDELSSNDLINDPRGNYKEFKGGKLWQHMRVADTFTAEAMACEQAVTFAIELGFCSVQVEGDSLSVIKKLVSAAPDKSILSPIIRDISSKKGFFESFTFSFVGRCGNGTAHALCREGLHHNNPRYWMEEAPEVVVQAAAKDLGS